MIMRFFRLFSAIEAIFELGFEVTESDFVELTPEAYACAEKEGAGTGERLYRIRDLTLLKNNKKTEGLLFCNEDEKDLLLEAVEFIYRASNKAKWEFKSFKERMLHVRGNLPNIKRSPADAGSKPAEQKKAKIIPILPDLDRT